MSRPLALTALAGALLITGCGSAAKSPREQVRKSFLALNADAARGDAAGVCSYYTAKARAMLTQAAGGGTCKSAMTRLIRTRMSTPQIVRIRVSGKSAKLTIRRSNGAEAGSIWLHTPSGWKIDQLGVRP